MGPCWLDTFQSLLPSGWHYIMSGLSDLLLTTDDLQSFALAIFILGLLSFTVGCLVWGLLRKGVPAKRGTERHGGTRRRCGTRGDEVAFAAMATGVSAGHTKRWITHRKHERFSSNMRRDSPRRSGGEVIISCREIPRSQPSLSCRSCRLLPAKRKCRYKQCGACCRANKLSICSAHGTGDVKAKGMVETACGEKPVELDISYMNLKYCPQLIGYVGRQLTVLNLSNNRLVSLPEEIGLLGGLEQLFLQYNCLEKLPKCIGNFSRLQELDCKNNHLQSLPSTLGRLSVLVILNVTNNLMTEMTSSVGQLTHLEELCAHSNQLTALPDELCNLVNLTALYVGENRLHSLPSSFGRLVRLTELDVSSCELTHLPASLSRCTSLNKVWLSNNRLTSLPDQIGRLHLLKELHVRNNPLEYFPASLSYLQLYTFSVNHDKLIDEWDQPSRNKMTFHPETSVPPLQELAARCISSNGLNWNEGDLPANLCEMLRNVRQCSCCEGPFFTYYSSELVFANIGIFHRVPLYQQICSPYYNIRCQPVTWNDHQVND
ncbi:leucine-rich repeat-containing protein 58-like isoform X3 [Lytechinus variegatus]|nr:leucine-rich repeat-containing protein 58-like isoform X3 [Lytechinus variegatus]XP_041467813.1 leucine-rich repeat-containing protein 58-like isoform X3 [Lytechinus variegatus]